MAHTSSSAARSSRSSRAKVNPEADWFGFTRVSPRQKTEKVTAVFRSVAARYDVMNDLMSFGLHRLWKDFFVTCLDPRPGEACLDVAGGTGDIAFRIAKRTKGHAKITLCDINPAMMKVGRARALDRGWDKEIAWVAGNAEALPFADNSFDKLSIVFGLRNVTRIDAALASFYRVLKPGGRFFCMEFSSGVSPWIKPVYDRFCETVMPPLGALVAQDRDSYKYLAESIQKFPNQASLCRRMEKAGFSLVKSLDLMGGIAVIHSGWKV